MKKYQVLQKKFPRFVYQAYTSSLKGKDLFISFDFYVAPDISFHPQIRIKNLNFQARKKIKTELFKNLVFHLGLIELFSYWKATCSPEIVIEPGSLTKNQIKWWQQLLIKGMGQFFYTNKINFQEKNFVNFKSGSTEKFTKKKVSLKNRILIPFSGGKDSIVTLELLRKDFKINCFCLNPLRSTKKCLKIAEISKPIIVERHIDRTLLALNKKGFLNGHTPFTAYLHFLSLLLAYVFDFNKVAFSNEKDADEPNLKYLGFKVNHQYSKTSEFEQKFRRYYKRYILEGIEVFSFLRYLSDLEISALFSNFSQYFSAFLSCNKGSKKNIWCGSCPKCFSTFLSLYPFLKTQEIRKIFGRNLLEEKKFLPLLKQFLDSKEIKPFECVMSRNQFRKALKISVQKAREEGNLPVILRAFVRRF